MASIEKVIVHPTAAGETRPATVPLFRPEVLAARREQAFGTLLFVQPLSTRLLTLVAVIVAAGLILLGFRGEYTRKARVAGYLVPTHGLIKVYSRETGTIVEKHVVEGQRVSRGDVLFVVSMERGSKETSEAQAAAIAKLRERRASLHGELSEQGHIAEIDTQGLRQQIDAKRSELAKLTEETATQERQVASAQSTLRMYQELAARSLSSQEQVQEKQKDVFEQQGRLEGLQRDQIGMTRDIETLRVLVNTSGLRAQTQQAAIERDISTLDQELTEYESRRVFVVTAPAEGTATAVLAELGQTANPSQPLVSLLPAGTSLQAHLFVPSHSIGFVARDQTVALQYQAFPYQRFGSYRGRVTEISRTLILPGETTSPVPLPEPAYRVTVALDLQSVKAYGQDFALQAGMLLDANIWLDRRKLYQWLLDPLYSVLGRV
jgi:membrane fusion protein